MIDDTSDEPRGERDDGGTRDAKLASSSRFDGAESRLRFEKDPRATRLVCTMGPASANADAVEQLILAGMNVARLNFSHGSHASHRETFELIRAVSARLGRPVAVLQDLQGHKVRAGEVAENGVDRVALRAGSRVLLGHGPRVTSQRIGVDYQSVERHVQAGHHVYLDDGLIELEVESARGSDLVCRVVVEGELGSRKGVIFPDSELEFPLIDEKDLEDAYFGAALGVDMIAMSFVRTASEVLSMREHLRSRGHEGVFIVAKIEDRNGADNIRSILFVADAVLVARGDLGVTVPREQVPGLQKMIIREANAVGVPVITATQMLESMTRADKPTRAEVNDVHNAVIDGSDAVMLSAETATGCFPVRAVEEMDAIAREAERFIRRMGRASTGPVHGKEGILDQMAASAVHLATHTNARCILAFSLSGATLRALASTRSDLPIYGVVRHEEIVRRLLLHRGLSMVAVPELLHLRDLVSSAVDRLKRQGIVSSGDRVVILARQRDEASRSIHVINVFEIR